MAKRVTIPKATYKKGDWIAFKHPGWVSPLGLYKAEVLSAVAQGEGKRLNYLYQVRVPIQDGEPVPNHNDGRAKPIIAEFTTYTVDDCIKGLTTEPEAKPAERPTPKKRATKKASKVA